VQNEHSPDGTASIPQDFGGGQRRLLIGLYLPRASKLAVVEERAGSAFMPNAFLRIGTDERVTVIVNHSEMGQGVYTALPMFARRGTRRGLEQDWLRIGAGRCQVQPSDLWHANYGRKFECVFGI